MQCGSGLCANVDSGRAAAARRSQAGHAPCARARSRPVPSRPAGTVSAGHAALGRRVVPMCNESAIDARPAQRSRGTGSRFGAGDGERRVSGGAHPVNWSPLGHPLELAGCSRPVSVRIRAPLGHGPVGTMPHRILGGREPIRARGRPPCPCGRWGCVFSQSGSDGPARRHAIDENVVPVVPPPVPLCVPAPSCWKPHRRGCARAPCTPALPSERTRLSRCRTFASRGAGAVLCEARGARRCIEARFNGSGAPTSARARAPVKRSEVGGRLGLGGGHLCCLSPFPGLTLTPTLAPDLCVLILARTP